MTTVVSAQIVALQAAIEAVEDATTRARAEARLMIQAARKFRVDRRLNAQAAQKESK